MHKTGSFFWSRRSTAVAAHSFTFTNMKSSGTRTSERLARKRQRLDEEEKKAPAGGLRPKVAGRPNEMDCGILPSE